MDPVSDAIIGSVSVIAVALLALLLAFGLTLLAEILMAGLAQAMEGVPGVGSDIATWIRGEVSDFNSYVSRLFSQALNEATRPITDAFDTVGGNLRAGAFSARRVFFTTALAFENLMFNTLPDMVSGSVTWTQGSFTTIEDWVKAAIGQAEQDVITWTQDSYAGLGSWAQGELTRGLTYTQGVAQTLESDVNVLTGSIAAAVTTTEGYAADLYGRATDYAYTLVTDTVGGIEAEIQRDYDALAGSITATQDWVQGGIGSVEHEIAGNQAMFVTLVVEGLVPAVETLVKEAEECFKPTCDHLGDFGKGFSSILGLIEDGALLAVLVAAIKDPEGAARTVGSEIGDLVSEPVNLFESLTGIRR